MRAALAPTLLAALSLLATPTAFSQTAKTIPAAAPGCGTTDTKFSLQTDKTRHQLGTPEPGKALIYFLQDDSNFNVRPRPTTRFAVDGSWVGATQANSYVSISLSPGEYILCADWQASQLGMHVLRKAMSSHVTAVAGDIYFFVVRDLAPDNSAGSLSFWPILIDEAQSLINGFVLSVSHPK